MSDWFGTHATEGPIKAGLDLEMPFPVNRAGKLIAAVASGAVSEEEIDARVLKMLDLRDRTKDCHSEEPETSELDEPTNQTARDLAAGGIVLLKNDSAALPLGTSDSSRVALIGEFAKDPVVTGGGSASCVPQYLISPVDALREAGAGDFTLEYACGVRIRRVIPLAPSELLSAPDGRPGIEVNYYNDESAQALLTEHREKPQVWMLGEFPKGLNVPGSRIELTTKLTPQSSGSHTMAVRCTGEYALYVDGKEVLVGDSREITTEQFIFNHILLETRIDIAMEAGRGYDIKLVMRSPDKLTIGEPTPYAACICFEDFRSEEQDIEEAVALAKTSDTSIIFAGRNGQYESEGYDLEDIRMPANQTRLIKAVAAASKKTVLVLHCGNPIDVSAFVDDVDAILVAHFPGQEGPRALADILTGKVNPSGRLTTTWFKTLKDAPSFDYFPAKRTSNGEISMRYGEGLQMGYRHPDLSRVRWPFGHGLSYTTFEYSDLSAKPEERTTGSTLECSITVTNKGAHSGHEVVQLYITPSTSTEVWRPAKELKAFKKISLQPSETKTLSLELDLQVACSYWDEHEVTWRMDEGKYGVVVGQLSADFTVTTAQRWNHL
jgi:beta-glucosidase